MIIHYTADTLIHCWMQGISNVTELAKDFIFLGNRVFQVDNESKESVHSELGTLTCLVRSLKILLSALESHSVQATVPIKNQSRTSL